MNAILRLTLPVALLALAACAKDQQRPAADSSAGDTSSSGSTTPYSGSSAGDVTSSSGARAGGGTIPTGRTVYFAFDSSELTSEGQAVVDAWASYLSANTSARVRLEGHCDERGTREYNVALGERRANAVLQALSSRGVSASQLNVTSFGEERPVSSGHDEAAWQQNRRVELVQ